MNREQTIEMGRLMIDFAGGETEVEIRRINFKAGGKWNCMRAPAIWDFDNFEYRRKPKPQEVWIWRYGNPPDNTRSLGEEHYGSKEHCAKVWSKANGRPVRFVEADQ